MKKLVLLVVFFGLLVTLANAQTDKESGKTYYDAEKTKPKEIFSYKENVSFDPNNPSARTSVLVKHGPYFYYYESGKLKISGNYMDDKKHGEWKYYDERGTLIRTEKYDHDKLVK